MIETILGILAIILLLDLIVVATVGAVWFCLHFINEFLIDELWNEIKQKIKQAQEEK